MADVYPESGLLISVLLAIHLLQKASWTCWRTEAKSVCLGTEAMSFILLLLDVDAAKSMPRGPHRGIKTTLPTPWYQDLAQ